MYKHDTEEMPSSLGHWRGPSTGTVTTPLYEDSGLISPSLPFPSFPFPSFPFPSLGILDDKSSTRMDVVYSFLNTVTMTTMNTTLITTLTTTLTLHKNMKPNPRQSSPFIDWDEWNTWPLDVYYHYSGGQLWADSSVSFPSLSSVRYHLQVAAGSHDLWSWRIHHP